MSPGGRSPERQIAMQPAAHSAGGQRVAARHPGRRRHPAGRDRPATSSIPGSAPCTSSHSKARPTRPSPRFPHTWVNWGQIGRMVKALRRNGCTQMVLAGTVRRPNLRCAAPGSRFVAGAAPLVADAAGRRRFGVCGASSPFSSARVHGRRPGRRGAASVGAGGPLGRLPADARASGGHRPRARAARDAGALRCRPGRGRHARSRSSPSRAPVARTRCSRALAASTPSAASPSCGAGGVLVKWPKPGQELRLDLPAVGPRTVELAAQAGLAGIAVQAGAAVFLERAAFRAAADAAGLFVVGLEPTTRRRAAPRRPCDEQPEAATPRTCRCARGACRASASASTSPWAAQLLAALAPHGVGSVCRRRAAVRAGGRSARNGARRARAGRRLAPMGPARAAARVGTLVVREAGAGASVAGGHAAAASASRGLEGGASGGACRGDIRLERTKI